MSDVYDQRWPREWALGVAKRYMEILCPLCQRIEIAGSLRREKETVGDIELVCVPKMGDGLFGDMPVYIPPLGSVVKDGERYKQYILGEHIKLDLFIVLPPAEWGVIFTLRTGGEEYNRKLVTQRNKGGWLPSDMCVKGGALWLCDWEVMPDGPILKPRDLIHTPEEVDFFKAIGKAWVEPRSRS